MNSPRPSGRSRRARLLVVALLLAPAAAVAQERELSFRPAPTDRPAELDLSGALAPPEKPSLFYQPNWNVQIEALGWFVAPGGFVQLPGGTTTQWLKDFNSDSPHESPFFNINVRENDWRLSLSAAVYDSSGRTSVQGAPGSIGAVPFNTGDPATISLDFTTFQAEVGYRLPVSGRVREGRPHPTFFSTWEVTAGARFFDVQTRFALPAGVAEGHDFFAAPYAGFRIDFEIVHGFSVDASVNVGYFNDGGDTSTYTSDVVAGFIWRPIENVGIEIGYRQVAFDLKSGKGTDEFHWDGALAGLYAGVVIRF